MNTDTSLANNLSLGDLQEFNTLGLQQIMNLSLALLNAIDTKYVYYKYNHFIIT